MEEDPSTAFGISEGFSGGGRHRASLKSDCVWHEADEGLKVKQGTGVSHGKEKDIERFCGKREANTLRHQRS